MAQNLPVPYINGVHYDPSSYEVRVVAPAIGSYQLFGLKALTYGDGLEPTDVTGTYPAMIGRTRGKYTSEASLELWKAFAEDFENALYTIDSSGIYTAVFDLVVTTFEPGAASPSAIVDVVVGCRIKKVDAPFPGAGEPASKKYDLHPMYLTHNNRTPFRAFRR